MFQVVLKSDFYLFPIDFFTFGDTFLLHLDETGPDERFYFDHLVPFLVEIGLHDILQHVLEQVLILLVYKSVLEDSGTLMGPQFDETDITTTAIMFHFTDPIKHLREVS
jgi:hypothetical protein